MTTPDSPRNTWPARKVRLDDQTWKAVRHKLLEDDETWQGVMETLARVWLAGRVDMAEFRALLKEQ